MNKTLHITIKSDRWAKFARIVERNGCTFYGGTTAKGEKYVISGKKSAVKACIAALNKHGFKE